MEAFGTSAREGRRAVHGRATANKHFDGGDDGPEQVAGFRPARQRGLTAMELVAAWGIAALLATLAVPGFAALRRSTGLTTSGQRTACRTPSGAELSRAAGRAGDRVSHGGRAHLSEPTSERARQPAPRRPRRHGAARAAGQAIGSGWFFTPRARELRLASPPRRTAVFHHLSSAAGHHGQR